MAVFILLSLGLVCGAYAETFHASFPEGCIGCLESITKADTVIETMPLPQGEIELTIDTKVKPRRTVGIICGPGDFFYRGWDQVYPETWFRAPGDIIEKYGTPKSDGDPEGVCGIDGEEHIVHMVTRLKLDRPILLEIAMDPSVEYHGGGPAWQYAQEKEITIGYTIVGQPGITPEPTTTGQPDLCTFTGTWDTNFGIMTLIQSGSQVTGTYESDDGQFIGTVAGNTVRGTWSEAPSYAPPNDIGDAEFILSSDCSTFTGNWRYGNTGSWGPAASWSGSWSGTLLS